MKWFNKWFQQRVSAVLISHLPLYITMRNAKGHGVGSNGFAKNQLREICASYCHHLRYHRHLPRLCLPSPPQQPLGQL